MLPRVPQLQTSPTCWGRLWCCHVALTLPPREESSGAVMYPTAPQRAVNHKNKEMPSCPRHAARLACVQSIVACY
jgi:hypothetical protein